MAAAARTRLGVAVAAAIAVAAALAARPTAGDGTAGDGIDAAAARCNPSPAATRRYYLSAERHAWDYTPSGINRCSGHPFAGPHEALYTRPGPGGQVGSAYIKARWVAYTDGRFATPAAPVDEHLGSVGPPLYAAAGDAVAVTVRNGLPFDVNFAVGGVVPAGRHPRGGVPPPVAPGTTREFVFCVGEAAAPPPAGRPGGHVPSTMHVYESDVDGHSAAGLYGPLVVTRRADADGDGKPAGMERGRGGGVGLWVGGRGGRLWSGGCWGVLVSVCHGGGEQEAPVCGATTGAADANRQLCSNPCLVLGSWCFWFVRAVGGRCRLHQRLYVPPHDARDGEPVVQREPRGGTAGEPGAPATRHRAGGTPTTRHACGYVGVGRAPRGDDACVVWWQFRSPLRPGLRCRRGCL